MHLAEPDLSATSTTGRPPSRESCQLEKLIRRCPSSGRPHEIQDVSYVSSVLAIENVLPDKRDVVAKPWTQADGRCLGCRRRQLQRARCDLLFETGAQDILCRCNIVHNARSLQGNRHRAVAIPRGTRGARIGSARKPSTRRLDVGMSTNLEVVEGGAGDSADSLGDFAREPRTHLLCTLSCLLAEAGNPKQLHL
ncbi:hypothetical protein MTO96_016916 [Rhipicephalus appendiculatus]